jgi:phosphohistidine phosphatase
MILYFLRHGIAEERETWTTDDALRPLTKKGENKLGDLADLLLKLEFQPDLIVTSPYRRAEQTAELIARRLGAMDRLVEDRRLEPGFGPAELAEIVRDNPGLNSMLLVGHEPDFSETVSNLIGGGRLVFKKAGLARVDLYSQLPLRGELVWFIPPSVV